MTRVRLAGTPAGLFGAAFRPPAFTLVSIPSLPGSLFSPFLQLLCAGLIPIRGLWERVGGALGVLEWLENVRELPCRAGLLWSHTGLLEKGETPLPL